MRRIALVHDFLLDLRGAERVFAAICDTWPEADVFTAVYDEKGTEGRFAHRSPKASFLQKLRPTSNTFRPLLPLSIYSATKAAAWSITTALREELADTLVVGVHAGFIDTDLAAAVATEDKIPPSQVVDATLDALRAGETEVLADDVSRAAKLALVA